MSVFDMVGHLYGFTVAFFMALSFTVAFFMALLFVAKYG
ncbi:hypothetical protein LTSEMIS_1022 [Salmonella enterica subsp. enterica serovar Mississippi str. A4-633]|nr:hypothetical protein LTSEMIS_1022 [Salmonella enterica subsp. enterica serovar Mississippi str. A4-633]